jgi:pantoate--beta-alanine ligase
LIVTESEQQLSLLCIKWREEGLTVGFVPTMGALHRGHISLVHLAAEASDRVVVSIFVNPAQFSAGEDLGRYPRTLLEDCRALNEAGADAVFTPGTETIYPDGFSTGVHVAGLTSVLCGAVRPGHFNGVTTVCSVLFGIVKPDLAVFGMKDAQQLAVIRRMVKDLRLGIRIIAGPVVRESDGLAMSSRNRYLSALERKEASLIFLGLKAAEQLFYDGERKCSLLKEAFLEVVQKSPQLRIQYVETVDPDTMCRIEHVESRVLLAAAIFAGETRLIDNIVIQPEV